MSREIEDSEKEYIESLINLDSALDKEVEALENELETLEVLSDIDENDSSGEYATEDVSTSGNASSEQESTGDEIPSTYNVPSEDNTKTPGTDGYDPNVNNYNNPNNVDGGSSGQGGIPRNNGLNDNQDGLNQNRESAPDMGKDYGSSQTPNEQQNSQQQGTPGANQPNEGDKIENFPDRQNPVDNTLPNQNPNADENKGSGLEKKDGLDDGKDKDSKDANANKQNSDGVESGKKNDTQGDTSSPGNGYGALKNQKKAGNPVDSTERARRNMQHNNQSNVGSQNAAKKADSSKKTSTPTARSGLSNLGNRFKNKLGGMFNRNRDETTSKGIKEGQKVDGKFATAIKNFLKELIKKNPWILLIFGFIFIIFFTVVADEIESNSKKSGSHCTYDLKGVTNMGSVKLDGLQVELVNCDATPGNYTVLETVDFEKYVLGVALAEIGPSSADEAIKTQIVAARGFSLTRNSGMCPSNPDDCFYGYNVSTGKIRMRACENDQVYWDYEKDIYRYARGSVSLYSPEVNSGTLWKAALSEERKAQVLALAEEVKGKVLVDSNDNVISTNYVASVSEQFISLAAEGKTYDQILNTVYADKGASGFSSGHCTSYGNIDYGDYVLSSDGHEILHTPLDSFLTSKGTSLEEFSGLIASNVEKAGYGTRAGVVAAAVTLIAELGNNYGVKIPYYWGGGHYDGVVDGALGYWGSTECHTYANGQSYNYCGFDCSGFVPWAIKNGGFNIAQMLAGNFKNLPGVQRVTLSSSSPVLQPGDLLESEGHIVLVVGVEESSKQYICAEASGNSSGVLFTRRPYTGGSGYWGVKMDGFYETRARS